VPTWLAGGDFAREPVATALSKLAADFEIEAVRKLL
jgi:hypothetical protein